MGTVPTFPLLTTFTEVGRAADKADEETYWAKGNSDQEENNVEDFKKIV